ncbi:hypothetical protein CAEBREN_28987 [Caenorhabditis brenneri]|uniref:F-box domain-containing protein n=1 Tax=Caenorhabditis brenneri TaxID=135651 RepID=G0PKB0_CAEBE|nr:hypothetical protein CAEBREN_28987 [Caenorhabditis brenneri]
MFDFELLPNEMQLEVLKRTEFRTIQSMKTVSKRVQKFIQVYKKYMMPIPIRQIFITPEKLSFTLSQSNEINTINHEDIDTFLRGAKVDVLWLEMLTIETEPIEFLQRIIQKTSFSQIECLKLGSSKVECDVAKLTELMKDLSCTELIVDWRFRVPEAFFKELHIEQNWKQGFLPWISMYNIVISFPVPELLVMLKNEACQKSPSRWTVSRNIDETTEDLDIGFFQSTNFSKNPSIVIRQFRNLIESW